MRCEVFDRFQWIHLNFNKARPKGFKKYNYSIYIYGKVLKEF